MEEWQEPGSVGENMIRVCENGKYSWDIQTDIVGGIPSGTGCLWQGLERASFFQGPSKASKSLSHLSERILL